MLSAPRIASSIAGKIWSPLRSTVMALPSVKGVPMTTSRRRRRTSLEVGSLDLRRVGQVVAHQIRPRRARLHTRPGTGCAHRARPSARRPGGGRCAATARAAGRCVSSLVPADSSSSTGAGRRLPPSSSGSSSGRRARSPVLLEELARPAPPAPVRAPGSAGARPRPAPSADTSATSGPKTARVGSGSDGQPHLSRRRRPSAWT